MYQTHNQNDALHLSDLGPHLSDPTAERKTSSYDGPHVDVSPSAQSSPPASCALPPSPTSTAVIEHSIKPTTQNQHQMVTRGKLGIFKPKRPFVGLAAYDPLHLRTAPRTVQEALKLDHWKRALFDRRGVLCSSSS
ncbi:hypothetical protein Salat_2971100 [Sesamum alatum]|uniref:Uncharacterized protein n=1 Tax=Sesamum alatum TaxID=300844 RepID=A0AAE1XHZ4_9LAMI|nr:hypothetical protein Salat_2971100 [Sesamum alatum]